jgi:hypothetical protein
MSDYKFFETEECKGLFEPKSFLNTAGIQDIVMKRLTSYVSLPNPSIMRDSYGTKSISASEQIFEKNRDSFLTMKETLLLNRDYVNKFVAVIDGKIADSDYDRSALAERVYTRYGYIQLFIGKVEQQKRYKELPSPERAKV